MTNSVQLHNKFNCGALSATKLSSVGQICRTPEQGVCKCKDDRQTVESSSTIETTNIVALRFQLCALLEYVCKPVLYATLYVAICQ